MAKKKLSIIVPCYKVEKYLPRCLDSLVNQTLEDIEVICINDGILGNEQGSDGRYRTCNSCSTCDF